MWQTLTPAYAATDLPAMCRTAPRLVFRQCSLLCRPNRPAARRSRPLDTEILTGQDRQFKKTASLLSPILEPDRNFLGFVRFRPSMRPDSDSCPFVCWCEEPVDRRFKPDQTRVTENSSAVPPVPCMRYPALPGPRMLPSLTARSCRPSSVIASRVPTTENSSNPVLAGAFALPSFVHVVPCSFQILATTPELVFVSEPKYIPEAVSLATSPTELAVPSDTLDRTVTSMAEMPSTTATDAPLALETTRPDEIASRPESIRQGDESTDASGRLKLSAKNCDGTGLGVGLGSGAGAGGGTTDATRPSAAKALSRPPDATLPTSDGRGSTPPRIAERISPTVMPGFLAASSATVPVTCGAAIEVPDIVP